MENQQHIAAHKFEAQQRKTKNIQLRDCKNNNAMMVRNLSVAALFYGTTVSMLPLSINSQISQAECKSYTNRLYITNRNLGVAEEDYNGVVSGSLRNNCLSEEGEIQPCDFNVEPSPAGEGFWNECISNAKGAMWAYQINPLCSKSDGEGGEDSPVDIHMGGIWVCASVNCTAAGVQNLISQPSYLDTLAEAGYTCGSVVVGSEAVVSANSGAITFLSPSLSMITMAVSAAVTGAFLAIQ